MGAGSSGTKQRCSKAAGLCRSPEDHGSRGGSSGSPTTPGRHLEAPWHEDSVGRRQLHASSPVWLRSVLFPAWHNSLGSGWAPRGPWHAPGGRREPLSLPALEPPSCFACNTALPGVRHLSGLFAIFNLEQS